MKTVSEETKKELSETKDKIANPVIKKAIVKKLKDFDKDISK